MQVETISPNLHNTVLVNTSISIWSGETSLSQEELPKNLSQSLPSRELLRLGSLKIIPKDYLKEFYSIRTQVRDLVLAYGIPLFGGVLVEESNLYSLCDKLDTLSLQFKDNVSKLVANYPAILNEWLNQNQAYKDLLKAKAPSIDKIKTKFCFNYSLLKIQPYDSKAIPNLANNTLEEIANVPSKARQDFVQALGDFSFKSLSGKVTKKTFRSISKLLDKLGHLVLLDNTLSDHLDKIKSFVDVLDTSKDDSVAVFKDIIDSTISILEESQPVKAEPVKAEPVKAEPVQPEPEPVQPVKAEPVQPEPEPAYDIYAALGLI